MKKGAIAIITLLSVVTMVACKKHQCAECHYDGVNGEVELGEKCGNDLENLEANGYNVDGTNYVVHCHEH